MPYLLRRAAAGAATSAAPERAQVEKKARRQEVLEQRRLKRNQLRSKRGRTNRAARKAAERAEKQAALDTMPKEQREQELREQEAKRAARLAQQAAQEELVRTALASGQRICIDLSFDAEMSEKENRCVVSIGGVCLMPCLLTQLWILDIVPYGGSVVFLSLRSLAKQIELSTVANKTAMCPCALTLTNFDKDSRVGTLLRSMAGKDMKWPLNFEAQPAWAAYSPEQLVYLTPDAADVLTELDPTKVIYRPPWTRALTMSSAICVLRESMFN